MQAISWSFMNSIGEILAWSHRIIHRAVIGMEVLLICTKLNIVATPLRTKHSEGVFFILDIEYCSHRLR